MARLIVGLALSNGTCSARPFLISLKLIAPSKASFVVKRGLRVILPGKIGEVVYTLEFKVSPPLAKSLAVQPQVKKEGKMSIYLGKFYFEEKDLFILMAALGLLIGWVRGLVLPFIFYPETIFLILLFLLAKGLLIKTYESLIFIIFLSAVFLLNFFPLSIVFLYIVLSFIFLRLKKII